MIYLLLKDGYNEIFYLRSFLGWLVLLSLIFSVGPLQIQAQVIRPNPATPFLEDVVLTESAKTSVSDESNDIQGIGTNSAFQSGADRLSLLQNNDGGWDWPLDDGNPGNANPLNTLGPIGMGLQRAYLHTNVSNHLTSLQNAGAFLLAKTKNFSPSDGYLAQALDQVLGGSIYYTHVLDNFFTPLSNGTYNRNGAGTLYDTAGYVPLIRNNRANQGIANLAAWDIGIGLVGAQSCGAETTAWVDGAKAEIDELDGSAYYDVIGLAGSIFGLAFAGEDFDPTAGEHIAASNINDLADTLTSYQIDGGGFAWNSRLCHPR